MGTEHTGGVLGPHAVVFIQGYIDIYVDIMSLCRDNEFIMLI